MNDEITIWLDFDGTIVEHAYPHIGMLNPHAIEVISKLHEKGHHIILNTKRIELANNSFTEATDFLIHHHVPVREYSPQKYYPTAFNPKTFALNNEVFIDDIATGIPLIPCREINGQMVD